MISDFFPKSQNKFICLQDNDSAPKESCDLSNVDRNSVVNCITGDEITIETTNLDCVNNKPQANKVDLLSKGVKASKPADFDLVVQAALKAPVEQGSVVFALYNQDPEEGWYSGRILKVNVNPDDGNISYDVKYYDGDIAYKMPRQYVIKAHPWVLRRFVSAVSDNTSSYNNYLRGQIIVAAGMLEDDLHHWLYNWKKCTGSNTDKLTFVVMYYDFDVNLPEQDRYLLEAMVLPNPNIIMLDLLSSKEPVNDVAESRLVDFWTHEVCTEPLNQIIEHEKEVAAAILKYQGPLLRGLKGQIVWAQQRNFAYWPALIIDPKFISISEFERWKHAAKTEYQKGMRAASKLANKQNVKVTKPASSSKQTLVQNEQNNNLAVTDNNVRQCT